MNEREGVEKESISGSFARGVASTNRNTGGLRRRRRGGGAAARFASRRLASASLRPSRTEATAVVAKRIASSAILAARNPFKQAREKGKGQSRGPLSRVHLRQRPGPIVGVRNEGVYSRAWLSGRSPSTRVCVYTCLRVYAWFSTCARTAEGSSGGSGSGGGEKEEGNRVVGYIRAVRYASNVFHRRCTVETNTLG